MLKDFRKMSIVIGMQCLMFMFITCSLSAKESAISEKSGKTFASEVTKSKDTGLTKTEGPDQSKDKEISTDSRGPKIDKYKSERSARFILF